LDGSSLKEDLRDEAEDQDEEEKGETREGSGGRMISL